MERHHCTPPASRVISASPCGCTARAPLSTPPTAAERHRCTCAWGHLDVAQWLHGAGASANATDNDGDTPLHFACSEGHLDVVRWLHSAGASLDAADNDGDTPLHLACGKGHLDVAQWLHSEGASLNATNNRGQTPLHLACCQGRLEIAQWLCSAGADATLKANDGSTPAQVLQHPDRVLQLDEQALRSALACLVRRAQDQGPLPCNPVPA